jgi:phosphotransferase system  glucose/maltose/N-acetylglucosamine-specific IIC component
MPLIFAIGVALGFTNNDGVSALASVVAYGIMVKTMAVVAPLVLHLPAEEEIAATWRYRRTRRYLRCHCSVHVQPLLSHQAA